MNFLGKIDTYMANPMNAESRKIAVSQKLKELRQLSKITQKDVCEIIQVTPQTYSGYEKGKYEPTMETIVRLAILYGVSTDHILCNWVDDLEAAESHLENIEENPTIKDLWMEIAIMREEIKHLKSLCNTE